MIKDITIGQFFPGNSVIHKLDPRIKLVLTFVYIVIVFLCKNFVSLASIVVALIVVILLSKISPKTDLEKCKTDIYYYCYYVAFTDFLQ